MPIRRYTKNRRGAGMVEYGLIVGLIAVGVIVAVQSSGDRVSALMNTVAHALGDVQNAIGASQAAQPLQAGDQIEDGMWFVGNHDGRGLFITGKSFEIRTSFGSSNHTNTGYRSVTDGEYNTGGQAPILPNPRPSGYCLDLVAHGYDDWYLPARDQLDQVWNEGAVIGDMEQEQYVTSTEISAGWVLYQRFTDGDIFGIEKQFSGQVRCMRD